MPEIEENIMLGKIIEGEDLKIHRPHKNPHKTVKLVTVKIIRIL